MAGHAALRWVRALLLAAVMLAAADSGHALAGGAALPPALVGPLLVVVAMAAAPFLDRPASTSRVAALALVGQALLHVALQVLALAAPMEGGAMTMSASSAHPMPDGTAMPHSSLSLLGGAHLGMLLAHVGAAVLVAVWLAAGERAAWTLVGVSALLVTRAGYAVVAACRVAPVVVLAVTETVVPGRDDRCLGRASVWDGRGGPARRGPPLGLAV